jgi:flagellin-like hook-associated protein FlgL
MKSHGKKIFPGSNSSNIFFIDNPKNNKLDLNKYINKPHNNINSKQNINNKTIKDDSFFSELMSIAMEIAIRQRDPKQILKTELMISEKGYSWYVDDANKVQVAKTDDVVKLLYNGEIKV